MLVLRAILFTIFVPGVVAGLIPYLMLTFYDPLYFPLGFVRYLGLLPLVVGLGFYGWTTWSFVVHGLGTPLPADAPRKLVVNGLYRHVRNPMYVGVLFVLLGEVLCAQSASLLIYTLGVFLLFNIFIRLYEEPTLKRTFGQQYEDYCKVVPRWVPRIRPQNVMQKE